MRCGFIVFLGSPGGLEANQGTTQRRACISRTAQARRRITPPPETRAMAGSRCAHTTTTMLHDQTHQEARPNEQSMHPSASDDTRSQQAHTRRAVTARQDRCQPTTRVRASDKHAHACTTIQTTKSTTPKDQAAHASGRSCVPANPQPQPPRQPHQRHDKKKLTEESSANERRAPVP